MHVYNFMKDDNLNQAVNIHVAIKNKFLKKFTFCLLLSSQTVEVLG